MGSSHGAASLISVHLPEYDANGSQDITLTYDAENRPTGVSGSVTASYVYDADGNRVKSVLNGETVIYVGNLQKFNFLLQPGQERAERRNGDLRRQPV